MIYFVLYLVLFYCYRVLHCFVIELNTIHFRYNSGHHHLLVYVLVLYCVVRRKLKYKNKDGITCFFWKYPLVLEESKITYIYKCNFIYFFIFETLDDGKSSEAKYVLPNAIYDGHNPLELK